MDDSARIVDLVNAVRQTAEALTAAAAMEAPDAQVLAEWNDVATGLSSLLYRQPTVPPADVDRFIIDLGNVRSAITTGTFAHAVRLSKPIFQQLAALPGDPIIDED